MILRKSKPINQFTLPPGKALKPSDFLSIGIGVDSPFDVDLKPLQLKTGKQRSKQTETIAFALDLAILSGVG